MIALDSGDKIRGDASTDVVVDYTLHGTDANAIKQLADGQLSDSTGDLYTADSVDVVATIILVNTHSSAVTCNLFLLPNGGTARRLIPKDMTLGIGYSLHTDGKLITVMDLSGGIISSTTALAHASSHENGDGDEISVAGLSGQLADDQHIVDAEAVSAVEAAGLTFAENKGIILDAVLSDDGKWSGITEAGTAGVALVFGDLVYLEDTGKWLLAKADSDTTSSGKLGMVVLAAVGDTDPTAVLLYGKIRAATLPGLTVGEPVYVSEDDAGDVEDAAPVGSGEIVRIIGYGSTAEDLFFCPDNTYVELA